ncbi:MAG TPA: peptidylprolyl isomerase [Candidatus Angelobacter sp.]|nr:peptidylprolyl isomerase [Candidatus Angelobacter sp.]
MIRFLQSGNKAAKYILGGFLLILAVSMVTYLIPGFMSGSDISRSNVVAKVAGEEISTEQVQKAVAAQMQRQRYPDAFAAFIRQQVVQQLIQQAELRYEAHRLGFTVSDEELRDDLQNGPYKVYLFPEGKWIGQQQYENLVTSSGGTIADFERSVKDEILMRKLVGAITAGVSASPAEIESAYKAKNTKVKFQYAVLNLADLSKQIKPTDAELKAFYQADMARYQNSIPEKRQVRYFVLPDKDAESKVTVDASDISRYYSEHQQDYRLPDRVKVRHILISIPPAGPDGKSDPKAVDAARTKAEDILKQVKAGGDFAELAKKNSQDPGSAEKGGELGWVVKDQTVAEFEKAAFALNPGQTSDLVQTSYGFHIIQVEEKETAHMKPLAEVKDNIEKTIRLQKASAYLDKKVREAEAAAQKDDLDKAAAKVGALVITSNPISRGESLPGVGAAPEVMNAIFATPEKTPPQSGRYPQGYVLFQVTKIDPSKTPAFDEIKERVESDFKTQRGNEMLQKKVQELADRAHAEHDLAKAAKEAGATVKTSDLVSPSSQVADLGAMNSQLSAAFSLKPGEISGPLNMGQKGVVLQVTDKQEPSLTDPQFTKDRDALQEQLSSQKRQQALELFMANLSDRLKKEGKLKENKQAEQGQGRRS